MDVIDRIEELRNRRGWSIYKLAAESGLTQSTLTNMYARGTYPSIPTLTAICEALGVTLSQFFSSGKNETVLSDDEAEIIEAYRLLSARNKKAIKSLVQSIE